MIKAVRPNYKPKDGELKFEVGKEYYSEEGFSYCSCAFDTLQFMPFNTPFKTRYLEIEPIDDICDIGNNTFFSKHIRVIREIDLMELCQTEPKFKQKHDYYDELIKKDNEKFQMQLAITREMNDMKYEAQKRRLRKLLPIALIPWVLLILYAVIPMLLAYLGIIK